MIVKTSDQGNVLILMPVAVLVFIILGALAVDHSIAFMSERALANASAAAANNAAAAMSADLFYGDSQVVLDTARAQQVAQATVRNERLTGIHDVAVKTTVDGNEIVVTVTGRVNSIFSRAIPGGTQSFSVGATSTASPEVPSP